MGANRFQQTQSFDAERFFSLVGGRLDERARREVAAAAALSFGRGGVTLVSMCSGVSRSSIHDGIRQLSLPEPENKVGGERRVRAVGGGRKALLEKDPGIRDAIAALVEPHVRGNPVSPLLWVSKSLAKIRDSLRSAGHSISDVTVGKILRGMGFTLQSCKKSHERCTSPDRDAQFRHIYSTTGRFLSRRQPVISVDTKKKELVGNYKNAGREYHRKGEPVEVETHDFMGQGGRATPYGVYDIANNEGFVNVGIGPDTAEFAVESIEKWWEKHGAARFPKAKQLYVNADGGGSNGSRCHLWKVKLQDFADKTGLAVTVSHFPPGTSKWNKIEHRMFSFITMNWRGRPLTSLATIVNLISNTSNKSGLRIYSETSDSTYATGLKVGKDEMKALSIKRDDFHPEWNYTLFPRKKKCCRHRR